MQLTDLVYPDTAPERIGGGAEWAEGPLWLPGRNCVIWSDIPGDRVLRWDAATGAVSVDRAGVEFTNGRALDREGRVVTCSHGRRAIERSGPGGAEEVL